MKAIILCLLIANIPVPILEPLIPDRALYYAILATWGGICGWHIWPWIDRKWGEE